MPRLVMKFGGTSVADLERISNAARRIECGHHPSEHGGHNRTKTIFLTHAGQTALEYDPVIDAVARIRTLPVDTQQQFINSVRSIALETGGKNSDYSKEDTAR